MAKGISNSGNFLSKLFSLGCSDSVNTRLIPNGRVINIVYHEFTTEISNDDSALTLKPSNISSEMMLAIIGNHVPYTKMQMAESRLPVAAANHAGFVSKDLLRISRRATNTILNNRKLNPADCS